ncbi:thiaminase II [Sporolactobacillus sp. THM7-4]|nr:thiaminase II [Sporolactobacillus sp. THM7-4]
MKLSEELRQVADPIFEAIFKHPFVQGIACGDVKREALIHYVKQDFSYLNAFIKVYGIAISKCDNRKDMQIFNDQISFILNSEIHPHRNFCKVAGVRYETLQHEPLVPTASHYIDHMLTVASSGSLAEILAALLPCPWTYWEIGKKLIAERHPDQNHPFYDWITFYGKNNGKKPLTEILYNRLDELTTNGSINEKERIKDHFIKSCQLEYAFWDMAYHLEEWPVKVSIKTNIGVSNAL